MISSREYDIAVMRSQAFMAEAARDRLIRQARQAQQAERAMRATSIQEFERVIHYARSVLTLLVAIAFGTNVN